MWPRLVLATIGVSLFLSLLYNLLGLRRGLRFDWDGLIERTLIVIVFSWGGVFYWLIPILIIIHSIYYFNVRGDLWFLKSAEPAAEFQKVRYKTEIILDIILGPLISILICLFIS